MAIDTSQPKDIDLDRTDKLPILTGISIEGDIFSSSSGMLGMAHGTYRACRSALRERFFCSRALP